MDSVVRWRGVSGLRGQGGVQRLTVEISANKLSSKDLFMVEKLLRNNVFGHMSRTQTRISLFSICSVYVFTMQDGWYYSGVSGIWECCTLGASMIKVLLGPVALLCQREKKDHGIWDIASFLLP